MAGTMVSPTSGVGGGAAAVVAAAAAADAARTGPSGFAPLLPFTAGDPL